MLQVKAFQSPLYLVVLSLSVIIPINSTAQSVVAPNVRVPTTASNNAFTGHNTFSSLNGNFFIDGTRYPLTPEGIQTAINQASAQGGGTVMLPPTKGVPISMGGVPVVMASNVWLRGSGRDVTVLQWTSVPPTGAITSVGGASGGFTHGGVTDLTLSFTSSAANASGFRFTTSDGDLGRVEYDTFQNIHILFSGYPGSQSAGFYITDSGSNTNFVLNTIDNVLVEQANQFAICGGCEGNFWTHLQCVNCGWTDRAELFEYAGLENDEVWDGRMEQGSNNQTNVTCLGFDKVREGGKGNIVRLVCDNIATGFAVHDSRNGSNMFLVTTVGGATLGKIRGSSQYSFVNLDAFTLSTAAPNLKAQHVDGCATAAFAGATCDIQVTWATPFTDANYSASCSGDHIASGVPIIQGVNAAGAKTAGAVTVRTYAMTAASAQFEAIDCVAVHSQGN